MPQFLRHPSPRSSWRIASRVIVPFAVGAVGLACNRPSPEDAEGKGAAITDIPNSSVVNQGRTGNCWLYATAAWAESLHASATGNTTLHFSPAYWNYWAWYDDIVGGQATVEFGGYVTRAMDIARRYGLMPLGAFVSDDAKVPVGALARINEALATGSLSQGEARSNGALVRQALDEAFQLSSSTRQLLTKTFGEDGRRTFDASAVASGALLRPKDVKVRTPRRGQAPADTTLDQLLGTPGAGEGTLAWKLASPPDATSANKAGVPGIFPASENIDYVVQAGDNVSSIAQRFHTTVELIKTLNALPDANRIAVGQHLLIPSLKSGDAPEPPPEPPPRPAPATTWRDFTLRIQRALNDGAALPLSWFVAFDNISNLGHFIQKKAPSVTASRTGWHASLLVDYEAVNVPKFGTLKAGTVATQEEKEAALDAAAKVSFFRIKNSWGTAGLAKEAWGKDVSTFAEDSDLATWFFSPLFSKLGYNDLDETYLRQSVPVCKDDNADKDLTKCQEVGPFVQDVLLPPGY